MKKFLLILSFLLCNLSAAQQWETNWEDAVALAKKTNHNIVLVFSGSDWCAPCIKLDKTIWQSADFQSYAKEHWVLLRADFPRKKGNQLSVEQSKSNGILAEKYNQNGYFPFVVVLNAEGKVLGQTSYKNSSPKEYIELLKAFEG